MNDFADDHHSELLAQVASLYYEQDKTQNEIAAELLLSRVKVHRLLQEARSSGVVQITIHWPMSSDLELASALESRFGLQKAIVLRVRRADDPQTLPRLGQLTARFLESRLRQATTMAICVGRATYEVVHAISPDAQTKVQVAQAIGTMPRFYQKYDSSALVGQLAQKLGGGVSYLPSPLMADTPEAAHVIRSQRDIEEALHVARSADIALIGIGTLDPETSGFVKTGLVDQAGLERLRREGAVGDMGWRMISADGQLFPADFDPRIIGLTLDDFQRIPMTIAVASGAVKAQAILGALRSGVINVLATDSETASLVLQAEAEIPVEA